MNFFAGGDGGGGLHLIYVSKFDLQKMYKRLNLDSDHSPELLSFS